MIKTKKTTVENEKYRIQPLVAGNYYHIYNRGNNGIDVFFEAGNYEYFLKLYQQYIYPIAETFAWCLMKNHFHVLDASKQFGHLFNAYTQAINKRFARTGSLFERPFERKRVTSEKYLKNLILYIHNNPVHHGFTKRCEDYPWSSYGPIISDKRTKLMRNDVIEFYGNKSNFLDYHSKQQDLGEISEFMID